MKKAILAGIISILFLTAAVLLVIAQSDRSRGTIRGAVYEDVDGDGRCVNTGVAGEDPVPNIDIVFTNGPIRVTLYTGANGTYGLASAGQGSWTVTANPNRAWTITSENPLHVRVLPDNELVQTGVNFCAERTGLDPVPTTAPPAASESETAVTTPATEKTPSIAELSATSEALLTSPPQPTATPEPSSESEEASETTTAPAGGGGNFALEADWLSYLNTFRSMGGAPNVANVEALSEGSRLHSRYMVVNDKPIAHNQDSNNPLFDPAGKQAAINGNIFATTQLDADYIWAINFWASAPFHLLPMMDPALREVGYGNYNEAVGTFTMAAVMDVRSRLGDGTAGDVDFPLYFPGDGAETWIVRHSLYEWPDPMAGCPGFSRPSGPPLVLQLGDGSLTPNVTAHAVLVDDQPLESCRFSETTYTNPDEYAQGVGRTILGDRDAVVVIPKQPLAVGQTYTVQIEADGETYTWSFSTRKGP